MSKIILHKIFQKCLFLILCIIIMGITGVSTELHASRKKDYTYYDRMNTQRLRDAGKHAKKKFDSQETFTFCPNINFRSPWAGPLLALVITSSIVPQGVLGERETDNKEVAPGNPQTDTQLQPVDCRPPDFPKHPSVLSPKFVNSPNLEALIKPKNNLLPSEVQPVIEEIYTFVRNQVFNPKKNLKDIIPQRSRKEIEELYKEVSVFDSGTSAYVFKARREGKEQRALRCTPWNTWGMIDFNVRQLEAFTHLEAVRSLSPFIPKLFDAWHGPLPLSFTEGSSDQHPTESFCIEMDFLEGHSYERFFGGNYFPDTGRKIPDRVLFEEYIGSWALWKHEIYIDDPDGDVLRHHLLTHDPKSVVYDLGKRGVYVFPPGLSPRQVDYDHYGLGNPHFGKYHSQKCRNQWYHQKSSLEGQNFMEEVCKKSGLFPSIEKTFEKYKVSNTNPLPPKEQASYFAIPEEYLDD